MDRSGLSEVSAPSHGSNFAPLPEMVDYLVGELAQANDMLARLEVKLSPVLVKGGYSDEGVDPSTTDERAPLAESIDSAISWTKELHSSIDRIGARLQL